MEGEDDAGEVEGTDDASNDAEDVAGEVEEEEAPAAPAAPVAEAAADRALTLDPKSSQALVYKAQVHLRRASAAPSASARSLP